MALWRPGPTGSVPSAVWATSVNLTAATANNTKSAWTTIGTSSFDTHRLMIAPGGVANAAQARNLLFDIGVGAVGSEAVLISNLNAGNNTANVGGRFIELPMFVPAGTRLSARYQTDDITLITAFSLAAFVMHYGPGGWDAPTPAFAVDTYGSDASISRSSVTVTCGVSGAWSSWVEVSSSWEHDTEMLMLLPDAGADAQLALAYLSCQIGVGAGGSEQVVGQFDVWESNTNEQIGCHNFPTARRAIKIKAGQRVAVRASSASTAPQIFGISLYGVRM